MSEVNVIIKRLFGAASLALVGRLFAAFLGFITNIVMAWLYGAERMGTYFIALSILTLASPFCSLGLDSGLLRFSAALEAEGKMEELKRIFWPAIGYVFLSGWLAVVGIYAYGGWLAGRFHSPHLTLVLNVMVLALPISLVSALLCETIRGLGGAKWAVVHGDVLLPLSFLVLLVGLGQAGFAVQDQSRLLALAYLGSTFLGLIFLFGWSKPIMPPNEPGAATTSFLDLLRYSFPLFLSSILWLALSGVDSLILGLFSYPDDVAYYQVAAKTALLVTFPLQAVNAVVTPLFAKFHQQGDMAGLENVAQATSRWMYFVALPLALLTLLLSPEILQLFGGSFAKARFALGVLAMGQLVNVACGSVGFILAMTGNQWTLIRTLAAAASLAVPMMALGAAAFGLYGLALASAGTTAGINILMAWGTWRRLGIKAYAQKVRWANLGGLMGISLFYLARPYLGAWGGAACFSLGYLALTAKIIKEELSGLLKVHPRHGKLLR